MDKKSLRTGGGTITSLPYEVADKKMWVATHIKKRNGVNFLVVEIRQPDGTNALLETIPLPE